MYQYNYYKTKGGANMIKLIEGNSNWDYFLNNNNIVEAIAKAGSGCDNSYFGDIGYIDKLLITSGINYLGLLTSAGFKALELNKARKGYYALKYNYLQKTNPINFYELLKGGCNV